NPIASALRDSEAADRVRAESERLNEERAATLPQVAASTGTQGTVDEVIYAPATSRGVLMPDLRGKSVRDAARICAQLGIQMEASGEGRALRQAPAAGAEVEAGRTVRIEFGRSD
ncbi:MAG TPA: PASTA domain-containing protein, partial [Pyrinomonadaceae bacterium]|nr:PASTA domain-containing protein [Pyrinomonadaceae bacterium]